MPNPSHVVSMPALNPQASALREAILDKLTYACGKTPPNAVAYDWYLATVLALRDRIVERWLESEQQIGRASCRERV